MISIRKLMAVGTGPIALCAVAAFALAPLTVFAHGSDRWEGSRGAVLSVKSTPIAVTLTPACTAAIAKIKAALADDRTEDAAEKADAALSAPNSAADLEEDKAEKAARKALWAETRAACAGQAVTKPAPPAGVAPSAACLAAKQAVKDAWTRTDKAAMKSAWSSLKTACGFSATGAFAFHHK